MFGDGVAPLTQESSDTVCPAREFACSWCPYRSFCEQKKKENT